MNTANNGAHDGAQNLPDGLTGEQTRRLLDCLEAIRNGDFTARMSEEVSGAAGEVAHSVNSLGDQLQGFAVETSRLLAAIGARGELGYQIPESAAAGTWKDLTGSLNHTSLILAAQVQEIAQIAAAVAEGDLTQKVTVAAAGEMGELKNSFNNMVDQLQLLKDSVNALMKRVSEMTAPSERNGRPE